MIWVALICLMVGFAFGILILALLQASAHADRMMDNDRLEDTWRKE